MFEPITIDTHRLRLRPLRMEDAQAFFKIWSDSEAVRYFSFPPMQDIGQAHARIAEKLQSSRDGSSVTCVIELSDTGEVLGDCGLFNGVSQSRRAEIGYCLSRKHWGNGYMIEAADALIEQGFKRVGLRRIEADIDPRNQPSIRLIERLGFMREGFLRERWMIGGEIADTVLYGLIQSDRYPA